MYLIVYMYCLFIKITIRKELDDKIEIFAIEMNESYNFYVISDHSESF